jgi:DNA-binding NarL/FixJ family response regulator
MRVVATCHPHRPHKARGLCGACYRRAQLRGTVASHPLNTDRPASDPYVDPIAVDLACAGERPPGLTVEERAAVVDRLTARGRSARQIAKLLGCAQRTVTRYRARARARTSPVGVLDQPAPPGSLAPSTQEAA